MSDTVKSWIEERRAIHTKSQSEGDWWADGDGTVMHHYEYGEEDCEVVTPFFVDDASSIVDAHNMFPRALDALNAVLELHRKERHQYGGWMCTQCTRNHPVPYPCKTVQAIEGAIND